MERTTLLCATDLDRSGALSADLAVALARDGGFHLELIHVADMAVDADTSRLEDDVRPAALALRQRIRERVERLAAQLEDERGRCAGQGVECVASLEEGRPWEAIVETATRREPRLVVVGPHEGTIEGRHRLGDRLLGTTASRVVRHAPCSVLVASAQRTPELRGATWVIGIDFSARSIDALRDTAELARATGGRLILVHALSAGERGPVDEAPAGWDDLVDWWRRDAHAHLRAEARTHAPDLEVEAHVEPGRPDHALTRAADEADAAIIVVGSHGHSGLARIVLGSTAERCLRHATRPVLVARRAEVGRE